VALVKVSKSYLDQKLERESIPGTCLSHAEANRE
jgi:hypothetical protein